MTPWPNLLWAELRAITPDADRQLSLANEFARRPECRKIKREHEQHFSDRVIGWRIRAELLEMMGE